MKGKLIWFLLGAVAAYLYCRHSNEQKMEELQAKTVDKASLKDLLSACKDRVKEATANGVQEIIDKVENLAGKEEEEE